MRARRNFFAANALRSLIGKTDPPLKGKRSMADIFPRCRSLVKDKMAGYEVKSQQSPWWNERNGVCRNVNKSEYNKLRVAPYESRIKKGMFIAHNLSASHSGVMRRPTHIITRSAAPYSLEVCLEGRDKRQVRASVDWAS
ncbi:hypothetical protein E2C01_015942 [Portunus trituberculatus]|uniref:Uncharacterized protein n=1 Tax=Portunus trituberculatus TaxID=210409 RepID=A0A5B7DPN0_PORTR|nr:hypothetical protein [Portunus trituberculatus]